MRGRKKTFCVTLTEDHRNQLQAWLRSTTLPAGLARRARVILLLVGGAALNAAAHTAGLTVRNARKWALRFLERGPDGLYDKTGRGRKPVFSPRGRPAPGQDGLRTAG